MYPQLSSIFPESAGGKHPLILVPGLGGSQLIVSESRESVWPPRLWPVLTGSWLEQFWRFVTLALGDEKVVTPGDLILEARGEDFYGDLLRAFKEVGYECVGLSELSPEANCIVFTWDWRQDLVEAAGELNRVIETIRTLRDEPRLKVDLVTHSAGGMLARYFIRFGAKDVLNASDYAEEINSTAAAKVRKLVLIGSPNHGSIFGLQRLMRGYEFGLVSIAPELMATMPSIYQLLPHPERDWVIDRHGRLLERDLYDPGVWREARKSIFNPEVRKRIWDRFDSREEADAYLERLERQFILNLRRGKRFHEALSVPNPKSPVDYIILGGDCLPTPALCLLEAVDGELKVRLHPDEVVRRIDGVDYEKLMLRPGDGRITRNSLLARDSLAAADSDSAPFPIKYLVFVCETHSSLPSSFITRYNLLNFLLLP